MDTPQFRQYHTDEVCYQQALALRNQVLRLPLGLDLFNEDLSDETQQWHFGLWRADRLVASVSIKPIDDFCVKLRQMCVSPDEQGSGLGRHLVVLVERALIARGIGEIQLAARTPIVGFYKKLGFVQEGEPFIEVTIPHQTMRKRLSP